jgi:hypothetical protein
VAGAAAYGDGVGGGSVLQRCVVTRTSYLKSGHTQVVRRWLDGGGDTYVVSNVLHVAHKAGGVKLQATLYFQRVEPKPEPKVADVVVQPCVDHANLPSPQALLERACPDSLKQR